MPMLPRERADAAGTARVPPARAPTRGGRPLLGPQETQALTLAKPGAAAHARRRRLRLASTSTTNTSSRKPARRLTRTLSEAGDGMWKRETSAWLWGLLCRHGTAQHGRTLAMVHRPARRVRGRRAEPCLLSSSSCTNSICILPHGVGCWRRVRHRSRGSCTATLHGLALWAWRLLRR